MSELNPSDRNTKRAAYSWLLRGLRVVAFPFWLLYRFIRFAMRRPFWLFGGVLLLFLAFFYVRRDAVSLRIEGTHGIQLTSEQIASIRDIRQWECMSIDTEEWVDTIRKGFFTDDRLARIYRGTLRLGVDLKQAPSDWLETDVDTVTLRLPDIVLLNPRFIDEARTRSFYESGKWNDKAREALYRQAHARMLRRGFTTQHVSEARRIAREQFTSLMRTFGFHTVRIEFVQPSRTGQ